MKSLAARIAPLLAVGSLCPLVHAGVLTVGPSGTFAEVSAALAAAQPGDTILVQPGTYGPFQVDKAVRIAATGPGVEIAAFGANAIRVVNLPAGAEVGLFGLEVRANPTVAIPPASIVVENNAGTVLLSDVWVDCEFAGIGLHTAGSERVVLVDCRIDDAGSIGSSPPRGAIESFNSHVYLVATRVRAHKGQSGFVEPGDHAMTAINGSVTLWRSELVGAAGVSGKGFFPLPAGGDGLSVSGTTVRHFGGPGSLLAGGNGALGFLSVVANGGTGLRLIGGASAVVQDAVVLQGGVAPAPGGPTPGALVAPSSTLAGDPTLHPTWLAASSKVAPGGTLSIPTAGAPSALCFPFASPASGPTLTLSGISGIALLDPFQLIPGPAFALDPTGAGALTFPIPTTPGLVGLGLWFQAISFDGAALALTNPLGVVVVN